MEQFTTAVTTRALARTTDEPCCTRCIERRKHTNVQDEEKTEHMGASRSNPHTPQSSNFLEFRHQRFDLWQLLLEQAGAGSTGFVCVGGGGREEAKKTKPSQGDTLE